MSPKFLRRFRRQPIAETFEQDPRVSEMINCIWENGGISASRIAQILESLKVPLTLEDTTNGINMGNAFSNEVKRISIRCVNQGILTIVLGENKNVYLLLDTKWAPQTAFDNTAGPFTLPQREPGQVGVLFGEKIPGVLTSQPPRTIAFVNSDLQNNYEKYRTPNESLRSRSNSLKK